MNKFALVFLLYSVVVSAVLESPPLRSRELRMGMKKKNSSSSSKAGKGSTTAPEPAPIQDFAYLSDLLVTGECGFFNQGPANPTTCVSFGGLPTSIYQCTKGCSLSTFCCKPDLLDLMTLVSSGVCIATTNPPEQCNNVAGSFGIAIVMGSTTYCCRSP